MLDSHDSGKTEAAALPPGDGPSVLMATPGLSLPVATGSNMMCGDQSGLLLGLEKQLQVSVPLTFVPVVSIC